MSTPSSPPAICFLLGLPRSGTTLLAHLLQQHPDILAPPEPWLMLALDAFGKVDRNHPADIGLLQTAITEFLSRIDRMAAYRSLADAAYSQYLDAAGKLCFIDKTPRYWMTTGLIDALYPEAPQIVLLRNPYAVAASLKSTWNIPLSLEDCTPDHSSFLADLILGKPALAARRHNPRTQVVHYEKLVRQPIEEVRRIVAGLGYDPSGVVTTTTADTEYLRSSNFGDRKILEKQTVDTSSIDSWQNELSPAEMQAVTDMVGTELIIDLGYAAELQQAYEAGVIDKGAAVSQQYRDAFDIWRALRNEQASKSPLTPPNAPKNPFLARIKSLAETPPEQQLRAAGETTEKLRRELAALEADHAARLTIIDERDTVITSLQNEVAELEQARTAVMAEMEAVRATNLAVIQERDAVIASLQNEVTELRRALAAAMAEMEAARVANSAAIQQRDTVIVSLQNEATELKRSLAAAMADSEAARTTSSAIIQQRDNEIATLQDEGARLKQLLATSEVVNFEMKRSRWWRLGARLMLTPVVETPGEPKLPQNEAPEILAFHAASTARALEKIAARSLEIRTVIDVGASNGMWSAIARKTYPASNYFLIEAQKVHERDLINYCKSTPNTHYLLAAAGNEVGHIFFDDSAPFGGVASHEATESARTVVPVTTIDQEVSSRQLNGPFLIKLDTHGFEVPILEGARETLRRSNLVVIEVYNFKITDQSLLFDEMCAYMRSLGFGVIDVSEPLWRQRDNAFWQMDLFFIPLNRPEFESRTYT